MNTDKIEALKLILEKDLNACDIKWTMFVCAAQSYRYDSRLKPFPPKYASDELNDIDGIINTIINVPSFNILLNYIRKRDYANLNLDVIDLVYWVLIILRDPILKSVNKKDIDSVLKKVQSVTPCIRPTCIFQLIPSQNSVSEQKFQQHAKDYKTLYAFHGSKLDSFHSIMNYGLQQHLCQNGLFGEGIYLTSEMHVCLPFSTIGPAWGASRCGKEISCIALCELIEHPIHLHCHTKENKNAVPDKYFVITNNEIVRIRYLLIYGKHENVNNDQLIPAESRSATMNWILNHKPLVAMCFYTVILISIGLGNSRHGLYFRHLFWQKTLEIFQNLKNSLSSYNKF